MRTNIVLIDSRVTGYQTLIDSLATPSEVFIIDAGSDGLVQIAARLQGRSDIDALHLISHGSQGALYLGATVLNSGNLATYATQLASIRGALTPTGDILLYGCNVAQGDIGFQFINSLAQATGADVAASSNATGASLLGGDAVLEQASGRVEAASLMLNGLTGLLAVNTAPTFAGGDGMTTTDFGTSDDTANSMTLQADGKILLAGYSVNSRGNYDFALVRYNSNGSLDTSFSDDGKLTTPIGTASDGANSMTLQADGKILLAGYSGGDFALVRYNSDGSLDTSFSGDGMLTTAVGSSSSAANSVTLQADGKILLAGYSYNSGSSNDFALVRYNSDGSLDSSFSGDGKLTTAIGTSYNVGQSVTLQADGKILLAGTSTNSSGYGGDFALARYNSDGSLDSSFSGDGMLITAVGASSSAANSVTLQADGKILLAGYGVNSRGNYVFALVRYNSDGSLDSSFSGDGKLITAVGASSDFGQSVKLQADGKILLAGYSYNSSSSYDFALVRYNSDGSLDTSFDNTLATSATTYTGSAPVRLDTNVQIYDAALSLSNNFYGSTVTLARHGGADASDVFSAKAAGTLSALTTGSYFSIAGASVGRVLANANGTLKLGFTAGSTQDQVNQTLQQIAYANTASIPAAKVQIDWTFSDGNTGSQGTGGALSVTGSTMVTITAGNVAPELAHALADINITPDRSFSHAVPSNTFSDANTGEPFVFSIAMVDGSAVPPWLSFDTVTGTFSGTPGIFDMGTVAIQITATDSAGASVSDVLNLTVSSNNSPTGSVTLSGTATQGQTLTAANTLADADGLGTISYQWLANGSAISGATARTLVLGQAQVGKLISVSASYTDGQGSAESQTSSATTAVFNLNDAPTGTVTLSGTATQGRTLTAANTLADADGLGSISYQWLANGSAISGATARTLVLGQAQVGKVISVKANYTDGQGSAESKTSSATTAVLNLNDAPTGTVTLSGTATQGQTLSAANTLADADGLGSISYQWLANGSAISGATASTLVLGQAQVGQAISVKASYTDTLGAAESKTSSATRAVVNLNDAATGSVTVSGSAAQGQTLSAANTLADLDGLGAISYQWLANGTAITGATASTLVLAAAQVGQTISVTASYTDGQATVESVTSAATSAVVIVLTPGVTFSNTAALTTTEDGGTAAFQVTLNAAPRHDVVLTLTLNDATEGKFLASGNTSTTVTFTAANWNVAQTVTLVGVDDGKLFDGNIAYTVLTAVSSDDLRYNGMRSGAGLPIDNLSVTNTDNDAPDVLRGDQSGLVTDDLLHGGNGASDVYGYAGRDEMYGGNGDDRIYGGYEDDVLYGEADNDEIEGEQGNDKLNGGTGNDNLKGGTGQDTLLGGDGSDMLNGGEDADSMNGGNGADTYYVDNTGDIVSDSGTDTGKDTVYITAFLATGYTLGAGIDNAALQALANNAGLTGNTGNNTLSGNASDNSLDGGAGNDSLIGGDGLDNLTGGDGADSLSGGLGNDILYAGSGDDVVDAGDGNDLIVGGDGAGNDRYTGGAGTDTVKYTSATAAITVNLSTGSASGTDIGSDSLAQIENVIGGKGSDRLTGDTLANSLSGDTGNDTLDGGAGADKMYGGLGNDSYYVRDSGDAVNEALSAGNDTVYSYLSAYTLGANVENGRIVAAGAASLTGNSADNVLYAGAGKNALSGGSGTDTVSYAYATTAVKVSLALATGQITGGSGTDTLTGIESVIGSNFDDTLTGGSGNNTLYGRAGSDVLAGGLGIDTFVFDTTLGSSNMDTLADFVHGSDKIVLDDDIFTKLGITGTNSGAALTTAKFQLGAAANDSGDRLIYNQTSGALYYDADGSGAGVAVQIALIGTTTHTALTATDFLVVA